MVRMLLAIATVSLAPLRDLAGQSKPATVFAHLRTGQTLRVRSHDGQTLEARLTGFDAEPLVLHLSAPDVAIPLSAVDSLWIKRHATVTGALVGAIALGAASFALGVAVCKGNTSGGRSCDDPGTVWKVGLGGTVGGALLGAAVGSLIPKWRLIHADGVGLSLGPARIGLSARARVPF